MEDDKPSHSHTHGFWHHAITAIRLHIQKRVWLPALRVMAQLTAGVAFYTCLPVPRSWALEFSTVARVAPVIGLLIGGLLTLLDLSLQVLAIPVLTRSALVVAVWVGLTGGLHLDGAMDTADGLAVQDPQRRLEVMADSRSGAFGVMAAGILLLLKTSALSDLTHDRGVSLLLACGWGRWGQLVAIARYPYLKPTGKGAFHKTAIHSLWQAVPTALLLLALGSLPIAWHSHEWHRSLYMTLGGGLIALLTGAWFNHKLRGQTGDTYGAIVEWTEALLLCLLTIS